MILLFVLVLFPRLVSSGDGKHCQFCFQEAGKLYGVSPVLLWAIAKHESGFNPRALGRNVNGTIDVGLMQINSTWYEHLGAERWQRLGEPCFNTKVGAWVLAQCVARHGYSWEAVGCYHSPDRCRGQAYARKIQNIVRLSQATGLSQAIRNREGPNGPEK